MRKAFHFECRMQQYHLWWIFMCRYIDLKRCLNVIRLMLCFFLLLLLLFYVNKLKEQIFLNHRCCRRERFVVQRFFFYYVICVVWVCFFFSQYHKVCMICWSAVSFLKGTQTIFTDNFDKTMYAAAVVVVFSRYSFIEYLTRPVYVLH